MKISLLSLLAVGFMPVVICSDGDTRSYFFHTTCPYARKVEISKKDLRDLTFAGHDALNVDVPASVAPSKVAALERQWASSSGIVIGSLVSSIGQPSLRSAISAAIQGTCLADQKLLFVATEVRFCSVNGARLAFILPGGARVIESASGKMITYDHFRKQYPECYPTDLLDKQVPSISSHMQATLDGLGKREKAVSVAALLPQLSNHPLKAVMQDIQDKGWEIRFKTDKEFIFFGMDKEIKVVLKLEPRDELSGDDARALRKDLDYVAYQVSEVFGMEHIMVPSKGVLFRRQYGVLSLFASFFTADALKQERNLAVRVLAQAIKRVGGGAFTWNAFATLLGYNPTTLKYPTRQYLEEQLIARSYLATIPTQHYADVSLFSIFTNMGNAHDRNIVLLYDADSDSLRLKLIDYGSWFNGKSQIVIPADSYCSIGSLSVYRESYPAIDDLIRRIDAFDFKRLDSIARAYPSVKTTALSSRVVSARAEKFKRYLRSTPPASMIDISDHMQS